MEGTLDSHVDNPGSSPCDNNANVLCVQVVYVGIPLKFHPVVNVLGNQIKACPSHIPYVYLVWDVIDQVSLKRRSGFLYISSSLSSFCFYTYK